MCGGGGLGNLFKEALPLIAAVAVPELAPELAAGLGGAAGIGALTGGAEGLLGGKGLLGTAEGALSGYGMGSLGGGLSTMGSALSNGASIGSAFSSGFPTISNIGNTIEKGISGLGSDVSSLFGGGLDSTQNPLTQGIASNMAANAGGASNTLNSMFSTGDTLSGMSGPASTGSALSTGSNLAAGGGGASAFSNLSAGGGSLLTPTGVADQAIMGGVGSAVAPAAATAASTGGSSMNLGSILSGISGLANAQTNSKAQSQLMAQQQLNQQQMAPFLQAGTTAAGNLQGLLNPGTSQAALASTPGYQFQLQQGNNALNNQMAASGMTGSGAALKAAQEFGQGLAGTTYQNAISNALAGSGLGTNAGAITSGYNTGIGNIGATASQAQNSNLLNTLAQLFGGKQSGLNFS